MQSFYVFSLMVYLTNVLLYLLLAMIFSKPYIISADFSDSFVAALGQTGGVLQLAYKSRRDRVMMSFLNARHY